MNSIWHTIMFFSFVILLLFGFNYFFWFSLKSFWPLKLFKVQIVSFLFLITMSLGFLTLSILVHFFDHLFWRGLYFVFAFWQGLFVKLFFSAILIWAVYFVFSLFQININKKLLFLIFFSLSFLWSLYGFYLASSHVLVEKKVKIKNLPDNWDGRRIAYISDVHLGPIWRSDFLERITRRIKGKKVEALFIGGDLFDGSGANLSEFLKPFQNLNTEYGTYYASGNHEFYLGLDKTAQAIKKAGVNNLDKKQIDLDGLKIIGLDYLGSQSKKASLKEMFANLEEYNPNDPIILLNHLPIRLAEAKEAGIDLMFSGHTHKGQIFPLGIVTYLIFGKFHYGLNYYGDLAVYTSSGAGTWGPPIKTSQRSEIVFITLEKFEE